MISFIAAAHAQQLSIRDRILDRCLVGLFSMQTQITMLTALYLRTGRLTITSGRLTIIARRRGGNSRALVRITSPFTSYFIQNMRGFLFIRSVLLILCCFTADRFQRWQDHVINEGPCVAFAFTHKHQKPLLATGRWIKNQYSKLRRKISRSCGVRPNDTYVSISSFSLFFVLLLAGDVELNPGPTTTSTNSHSENSAVELPTLVARANLHQGDASFSEESRGRQCGFMALTSLAYHHHELAVTNWQPETLDEILNIGDSQFLDALQRALIPDGPNLSVEQLPTTVCFATANEGNNNLSFVTPSVTKPIVVLPLMATKANTLEIPIEASNSDFPIVERESESPLVVMNSELPIVATKATVARPKIDIHSKLNEFDDSGSSVIFGDIFQGSFFCNTQNDNDSPFIPLHTSLQNVFTNDNSAIFILEGYMISIIHSPNSGFYVFDSHARNPLGMPDMNGKAVLLSLRNIFSSENYLQLLATEVNATFFEAVSVTFHNLNCSQSQEFALTINPRKRKHPTQNYYESEQLQKLKESNQFVSNNYKNKSECKRQQQPAKMQWYKANESESIRQDQLLRMRLYEAKRQANETEFERKQRLAKRQQNGNKKPAKETELKRKERLSKRRQSRAKKLANETESERMERLAKQQQNTNKKRANETEFETEQRLAKQRQINARKLANETESERAQRLARNRQNKATKEIDDTDLQMTEQLQKPRMQKNKNQHPKHDKINYLAEFNVSNGFIYEQAWAKINMNRFHETSRFSLKQCKICFETWPVKSVAVSENFSCARCSRDKKLPKRFSKENDMIPSRVPRELQGLTQTEEMLIACALPMMSVYVRPGGQEVTVAIVLTCHPHRSKCYEAMPILSTKQSQLF